MKKIIFNGVDLPKFSFFLDVAASKKFNSYVTEDVSIWFWKFSICIGVELKSLSKEVEFYSTNLIESLRKMDYEILMKKIEHRFPGVSSHLVLNDWLSGLDIMLYQASKTSYCKWEGVLLE